MRAFEETRPAPGRRVPARLGGAILVALVAAAACSGENLFTGPATGRQPGLLGPSVNITGPAGPVIVAPGDSLNVTAAVASDEGVTEVSFTSSLDAGGPAPFTPIVIPLAAVTDTTISRFMVRSGTTPGAAKIIVTARDITGKTGADTVSVTLGG